MNNVHPIPLQSKRQQSVLEAQRLEQACEWIARIDRELQTEEKQALQQWLAASALNQQTLFEVAKLWDKMDALSRLSDLFPAVEPKISQQSRPLSGLAMAASAAPSAAVFPSISAISAPAARKIWSPMSVIACSSIMIAAISAPISAR